MLVAPPRSNWASISAMSTWYARSAAPRSIASFLQRVGRSGHAVDSTPKAGSSRCRATGTRRVRGAALIACGAASSMQRLSIPELPLVVLAQQIVAEAAAQEWSEGELFYADPPLAWPYRDLPRADFDASVAMLAEGFSTRRGRRGAASFITTRSTACCAAGAARG